MTRANLEAVKDNIKDTPELYNLIMNQKSTTTFLSKKDDIKLSTGENLPNSICFLQTNDSVRPILMGSRLGASNNVVKLSLDLLSEEFVALKIVKSVAQSDEQALFSEREEKRELQALTQFNRFRGSAVVRKNKGQVKYYAQSLIDGADLQQYIKELENHSQTTNNRTTLQEVFDEVVKVAYLVCDSVEAFHDKGFLHRDIKPANMILNKDEPMTLTLIDFGGLVKEAHIDEDLEQDYGTRAYMSPEILSGNEKHSRASDAFAAGKTIKDMISILENGKFRLMTGRGAGKNVYQTLREVSENLMDESPITRLTLSEARDTLERLLVSHDIVTSRKISL